MGRPGNRRCPIDSTEGLAGTKRTRYDGLALKPDDPSMAQCQICGQSFDERAYQIIVSGVGAFDSVECAEKAMRKQTRKADLAEALAQELADRTAEAAPPVGSELDPEQAG